MGYFKEVRTEMKKVTWPTFKEVNRYTWTVLIMVLAFSVYFAAVDYGFDWLFSSNGLIGWIKDLIK